MKLAYRILIFLILNFAALGIGSLFTNAGVTSEWYQNLSKAPWTPPGWVFGASWTFIMICFAIYMAFAWEAITNHRYLIALYAFQFFLNVCWNPVFFKLHLVLAGLIVITALTLLIGYFLFGYSSQLKGKAWLASPYFLWLIIATSLNLYIYMYN